MNVFLKEKHKKSS